MSELLFVYNAKAGTLQGLIDTVHKTLSPSTYECNLCAITYGAIAMKPAWRDYLNSLPHEVRFFHKDDFQSAYPSLEVELPLVLLKEGDQVRTVLSAQEVNAQHDVNALIAAMDHALQRLQGDS
ncbi:MAG: hypothetical protein ACOY3Z_06710 [Thermodesulfobacteriota bacterium]